MGADINGTRGWISAPPAKVMSLSLLTLKVVELGFCHVGTLWMLAGVLGARLPLPEACDVSSRSRLSRIVG